MSPKSTELETQAAELLRTVDLAATELNQTALDGAREQEEARQNARLAAAMIRRYSSRTTTNHGRSQTHQQATPIVISKSSSTTSSSPSSSPPPRPSAQARLLELGLELERCQRGLAEEKQAHEETQQALEAARVEARQHAAHVQQLLQQQETWREDAGRRHDELQRELTRTTQRLEAAEQDADLALELATNNNAAREEMEVWYRQCLERNQALEMAVEQRELLVLQNQSTDGAELPQLSHHEHSTEGHESTVALPKKSLSPMDNAMVASGRRLLEDFRGKHRAPDNESITATLMDPQAVAERSHERRRQLADRLKWMEDATTNADADAAAPATTHPSSSSLALTGQVPSQASGTFGRMAKMVRESGRRLSLPGRWWNKTSANNEDKKNEPTASPEETETLTKHYCQAVELLVERKQNELFELESFCALMESGDSKE